jgi:hypothetical protein
MQAERPVRRMDGQTSDDDSLGRKKKKKKTTLSVDDGSLGREKKKKPCPSVGRGPETRRTEPRISGPRLGTWTHGQTAELIY